MNTDDIRISGSEVGAMLGVSKWATPLRLFRLRRGEIAPTEDNALLEEGREFEDAIYRIACRKYKWQDVLAPLQKDDRGYIVRSKVAPIDGHVDRFIVEDGKLVPVEVKHTMFGSVGDDLWGDPGSADVPPGYRLQLMTYLGLCRETLPDAADYGYIVARLAGGVTHYKVALDEIELSTIYAGARDFVRRIRENDPPPPVAADDGNLIAMADPDASVVATDPILGMLRTLRDLGEQRKEIVRQEDECKAAILAFAGNASSILHDGKRVASIGSWRVFAADKFAADNPAVAASYQTLDTSRLRKEHAALYETYMRLPASFDEQRRSIRVLKSLENS